MGLLDAISPTPRNRIIGLLADATQGVNDFASKPFGYDNPPARMLMGLLGVPSIATTLDRLSYGEPLTNIGKANVALLKPETADAAMAAAAALPAVSRGALKASDAAVRAITRNPEATATKVMDYAAQINPMNPMVVYHGSPHKFDKFDSSKIGTGEGAQAYGHGLYLAESPETAAFYREKLTSDGTLGGYKSANEARQRILLKTADRVEATDPQRAAKLRADAEAITPGGALYKVDLPDSAIAKMLDWDKPLSQQAPEVRVALTNIARNDDEVMRLFKDIGRDGPGNQAYAALTQLAARRKKYEGMRAGLDEQAARPPLSYAQDVASVLLRQQGIPGIRYLDGGSRGAGAGTSNFVVFPGNEGLLSILERNGVPVK